MVKIMRRMLKEGVRCSERTGGRNPAGRGVTLGRRANPGKKERELDAEQGGKYFDENQCSHRML